MIKGRKGRTMRYKQRGGALNLGHMILDAIGRGGRALNGSSNLSMKGNYILEEVTSAIQEDPSQRVKITDEQVQNELDSMVEKGTLIKIRNMYEIVPSERDRAPSRDMRRSKHMRRNKHMRRSKTRGVHHK